MEYTNKLKGKIAVVAGATRGAGRGIACMLGEAGATVYCTGRSLRAQPSDKNRPAMTLGSSVIANPAFLQSLPVPVALPVVGISINSVIASSGVSDESILSFHMV
jgi:NAD(P)-dependent dehydrogenase (short-subunit alcohol dehydrogenase family)